MEPVKVGVSYRDKQTKQVVELPDLELQKPQTLDEALELYEGEKFMLDYAFSSYVIERQNQARSSGRTDQEKDPAKARVAAFKNMTAEKQEEMLRAYGLPL